MGSGHANWLVALALATLGCSDDSTSGGGGGTDAGSGASAGTGASAGGGAAGSGTAGSSSGGTAGSSTGGGSGGTAGSSSGGTAGSSAGGAGGVPENCRTDGFPDATLVARASVGMMSCFSDDGYYRTPVYLRGVRGDWHISLQLAECIANATGGCSEIREQCAGFATWQTGDPCDTCVGNVAYYCGGEGPMRWDCDKWGGQCSDGLCTSGTPCDETTYTAHCDASDRPTRCRNGVRQGPVCSQHGLECADLSWRGPVCQGTGADCSEDDAYSFPLGYGGLACNGDTLSACVNGKTADLYCPCHGPGFRCQSAGGSFFCGAGGECDPHADTGGWCEGTSVVFCDAGVVARVDCTSMGFSECVDGSYAYCR